MQSGTVPETRDVERESTLDQSGSGSDIATRLVVRPRWPSTLTGTPQEQFRCELLYGYGLVLLSS